MISKGFWIAEAGFEPTTSGLWARRATGLLYSASLKNGWGRIRTFEAIATDLQSAPFGHSGTQPYYIKPMNGLEPLTCWLQVSCSANWATSALFQRLQNQTRSLTQIKLFSLLTFSFRSSPRPISISKLNTLLYLHLWPIYLVVFKGSYFISEWEISSWGRLHA